MERQIEFFDDLERMLWCVAFAVEQNRRGVNVDKEQSDTNVRQANAVVLAHRLTRV